ncbi:MAG: (2Fe-2S)-binding protein [Deltaproteobacteria bacterium]|nr:(2Fe-2S)-binding protein [Deltaproteobacteria bacterium]
MKLHHINLLINGEIYEVLVRPDEFLVDVLRNKLGLTGTKKACDMGVCGACTVLLDGMPVSSCLTLAVDAEDKEITTIEGLEGPGGKLHPLQEAFIEKGAVQCGFCTSGMIMTAVAFLQKHSNPSELEVRRALSGNICRCTGYAKIIQAVEEAASKICSLSND